MVDKRLFTLAPGVGRLVAAKVVCLWVSLLVDIAFVFTLVGLLGQLLLPLTLLRGTSQTVDPPASMQWQPSDYGYLTILLLFIALIKYLAIRAAAHFGTEAAERVKFALRERLYRKMLALGPAYSQLVRTSDVVQSAGEGIEQIQSFFDRFLPQLFFSILAPLTLFVVLLPINVPAALVLLVCAPLIVAIVGLIGKRTSKIFMRYWGKYTDMGASFLDDLQGLETLKAFDADERAARTMNYKAESFRVMTMKVLQIQLQSLSAMDLVAYGGTAAGIAVAFWQFAAGHIGLPAGLVIILLSASFFLPLRQLGTYFHVAMNGMTSTRRIFALLDAPEAQQGREEIDADDDSLSVVFDQVGYVYPQPIKADGKMRPGLAGQSDQTGQSGEQVRQGQSPAGKAPVALQGVSFRMEPGHLTALVGSSGSGKSTAAAILAGTLTGYSGSLTLHYDQLGMAKSCELRDFKADSLIRTVTLVCAHSHLFAGTLRENLLMARPSATDTQLWEALALAHIDGFVYRQQAGLDMPIAEGASNLSGGQRQRIAIARALLHDGSIYIFDEATSSVDPSSEALILESIHELARHKTVLMITHRLANAVDADRIVVFDQGRAIEAGSHQELMAANGRYWELYRAQEAVEDLGEGRQAPQPLSQKAEAMDGRDEEAGQPEDAGDPESLDQSGPAGQSPAADLGNLALVKRLLKEVGSLTPIMLAACIFGVIGHMSAIFLPVFGLFAFLAQLGRPVWGMGTGSALLALAACALVRGLMRYGEQYMNHNMAFRLLALFRQKAFTALRRLAPAKLSGAGKGDLVALITTDVELLEIFFAHTISPVLIALLTTVLCVLALAFISPWYVPLLVLAHLVMGLVVPRLFASNLQGIGKQIRRVSAALDARVLDDMRGLGEIIRFGQGKNRLSQVLDRTRVLWARRARLSRKNGNFEGISALVVMVSTVAAAWLGLVLIGQEGLSAAGSLVAIVLIASSFGPTSALSALPASLTQTFASARRMFALLDEVPAVEERGSGKPAYTGMALEAVSFSYDSARPANSTDSTMPSSGHQVLDHFDLTVPRQAILGIQGPSGRGKSTVLKLLMRYWDPQQGRVSFSNQPLPQIDAHYRRKVQTLMSQETYLFDGSIRDNLLLASPGAGDQDLRRALGQASVLDLIDSLPHGLQTNVGELGGRMSEGERQRIGLARIFLREAQLVLFDEPTSRLDALNEAVILQSIKRLADGGNTDIVMVSHRPSAMRIADQVLTL
ncbi:ABC transporter ATP-binding protein [Bifidobacterium aemilianum]|uniref:ABC transporter ATP-binding protein n=1 Tax=Bifidobacterium aemilianum TaxID=2493120 RepID=A0A366K8G7_9BIFI|nr:ATP-binding cassette domain-containing protein [Bifidobacterium aemilianum]RBP97458.1 ABC transporter ATP-binding protein [Bifidobacterium aemilianum]